MSGGQNTKTYLLKILGLKYQSIFQLLNENTNLTI